MKVELTDGRVAQIGVQIGEEAPDWRLMQVLMFRSVRINITISKDGEEVGQVAGVSYCNPADQFVRAEGRKKALRRLLQKDAHQLLSKEDRSILCPIIVRGYTNQKSRLRDKIKSLETKLVKLNASLLDRSQG